MLISLKVKNFTSFKEEIYFSMEATKDGSLKDINTFNVDESIMPQGENTLLKSAVIFGPNASGKTNVLKALAYMRNVVLLSGAQQLPVVRSNTPFILNTKSILEPSCYEVEFIANGKYYKYGFKIKQGAIVEEWLDKRVERLVNVFKRVGGDLQIMGLDKNATKLISLNGQMTFLSVAANFNLDIAPYIKDVIDWFSKMLIVFENSQNSLDIYSANNGKYKEQALKILKLADIGIVGMNVKKDKLANIHSINDILAIATQQQVLPEFALGQLKQEANSLFNIDLSTEFNVYDDKGNIATKRQVMLMKDRGFNSEGTERLLFYMGWILAALDLGSVLVVDEIDSKLHFLVADYLIRMFNSIDQNPHNAQLICTAHNTMLMDEDLRRDQIYFTSKDYKGESNLVALSDFTNVRKTDLFSKKYLAGFYSKLPDMSREV